MTWRHAHRRREPAVCAPRRSADLTTSRRSSEVLTRSRRSTRASPAKIVERMVEGRIEKYYKEVCLLEQPFVKDPRHQCDQDAQAARTDVVRFVRFERGEGLEKRQDNLAADIAAEQAKMKK